METRNPVIARMEKEAKANGGYAGFGATATATQAAPAGYDVPPTMPVEMTPASAPMTINDVVVRTATMFVPLLITAYFAWTLQVSFGIVLIAMLVALGLGFCGAPSPRRSVRWSSWRTPPSRVSWSVASASGCRSGSTRASWAAGQTDPPNIVLQAVIGTLGCVRGDALPLRHPDHQGHRSLQEDDGRRDDRLPRHRHASACSRPSLFGVGDGWGFYGVGGIGILLCVAGVALASFSLVLDFDAIEEGVKLGVPERESWRAAFGLTVTLVWLYLEILRLLAILNRN